MRFSNPYFRLIRAAWHHAEGRRATMAVAYAFFVIANVVTMFEPYVLGRAFNALQQGGDGMLKRVTILLCIYASLSFFFWIFHGTARLWERMNAFHIDAHLKTSMFRMITRLPQQWHRDNHTGETYDKIQKSSAALQGFGNDGSQYIATFIRSAAAIVGIVSFTPIYGSIAIVMSVVIIRIARGFDKKLAANRADINRLDHRVALTFYDYVSNIKTVIALRLESLAHDRYARVLGGLLPFVRRDIRVNELKWFFLSMLVTVMTTGVLALHIIGEVRAGQTLMIGNITMLYGYLSRFADGFRAIAWQWEQIVQRSINVSVTGPIDDAHAALSQQEDVERPRASWQIIRIRNLAFAYKDGEQRGRGLRDVSIDLPRGGRIALIGESGSGKSTLLSLLRGLETPDEVSADIDGRASAHLRDIASISTLIPQDPELFEQTLMYNITLGADASEEEILRACAVARFDVVLRRLPKGLLTDIKERGVNLSGGEKQRLALARGVFAARASDIILMDEPTSSVDPVNQLRIYRNVFAAFEGRTVVSSIHQLHLLPLFDMIHVLDRGKIIESGTFAELSCRKDGAFHDMLSHEPQRAHDSPTIKSFSAHTSAHLLDEQEALAVY